MAKQCSRCEHMWRRYAGVVTTYSLLVQYTTEPAEAGGAAAVVTMMLLEDLDQLQLAIDRHERDVHGRSTPWSPGRGPERACARATLSFAGEVS